MWLRSVFLKTLRDYRIAGVLSRPRAEFVAQRVPHEPLVAAPLQAGELEQLPPHAAEVLLPASVVRSEHVRIGIVAKRESALL